MTICFSGALFLSACLLFWLELIFARLVLPLLGGSPAVWNTCTVFYQILLLGGYVYAHASASFLGLRRQTILHSGLLVLTLFFLPIGLSTQWLPSATDNPIWGLLKLALVSVGPPLFIISAASPLLQKWFSSTKDPRAKDPYFLFQASNLGSLLALLSYPVLIEPYLKLRQQNLLWSFGYGVASVVTLICAVLAWRAPDDRERSRQETYSTPWPERLRWACLAFVPSSLMLAVTTYLSNFISPIPLLWVIPLALYLLSFVLTFGRKPWVPHAWMIRAQPFLLMPLALLMMTDTVRPAWVLILFHFATLAVTAMVCHGELARRRPPARQLTEFYLWLAIGGALGGAFNALLGPWLFKTVAEYPLTLILACLVRPKDPNSEPINWFDLILPLALGLATAAVPSALQSLGFQAGGLSLKPFLCLPTLLCFLFKDRPVRLGFGLAMLLLGSLPYTVETGHVIYIERSFFGVHRVIVDPENKFHWLSHGNIVHGGQNLDPAMAHEPLSYYTRSGPVGQMFAKLGINKEKAPIALVGLGTGCMACYGRMGQSWIFYEIDPVVGRIASDPRYFSFLRDCPPRSQIVFGDARLSLRDAPDHFYRWIIVDAFNSDAIPVHLLTREAMHLYVSKISSHGFLAFHISNHFLDLEPVLASLTQDAGLSALIEHDDNSDAEGKQPGKSASDWVVVALEPSDLAPLRQDSRWRELQGSLGSVWSDDYSNLLQIIRWN